MSEAVETSSVLEPTPVALPRPRARKLLWAGLLALGALAAVGFAVVKLAVPPGTEVKSAAIGSVSYLVKEGTTVKAGDVVAIIDREKLEGEVARAELVLNQAFAEAQDANIAIAIPDLPDPNVPSGRIVETPTTIIVPRVSEYTNASDKALKIYRDSLHKAQGDLARAENEVRLAREAPQLLEQELLNLRAMLQQLQTRREPAAKAVEVAQVTADRAKAEKDKISRLVASGAVAAKEASRAEADYQIANGALTSNKKNLAALDAQIAETESQIKAKEEQAKNAGEAITEAESKVGRYRELVADAEQQLKTASANGGNGALPQLQRIVKKPGGVKLDGPVNPATDKPENEFAPAEVEVDTSARKETEKKIRAAQADLEAAQKLLKRATIVAPKTGRIEFVKKNGAGVKSGDVVFIVRG